MPPVSLPSVRATQIEEAVLSPLLGTLKEETLDNSKNHPSKPLSVVYQKKGGPSRPELPNPEGQSQAESGEREWPGGLRVPDDHILLVLSLRWRALQMEIIANQLSFLSGKSRPLHSEGKPEALTTRSASGTTTTSPSAAQGSARSQGLVHVFNKLNLWFSLISLGGPSHSQPGHPQAPQPASQDSHNRALPYTSPSLFYLLLPSPPGSHSHGLIFPQCPALLATTSLTYKCLSTSPSPFSTLPPLSRSSLSPTPLRSLPRNPRPVW
ncbi:uncharacterized protein LOC119003645 [Sturnira hondurensis]|uniref:uncharacterized protein LOC119003645 n=1 Tax=Sturnira hondurensis TaxID=192404 RepID=UPI00187AF5C1|nr:uncharacterized protein LOC119003645 [Sturnira hondurensis]